MANQKIWITGIGETDTEPMHQGNPVSAYQTGDECIPASGLKGERFQKCHSKLGYQMMELSKLSDRDS